MDIKRQDMVTSTYVLDRVSLPNAHEEPIAFICLLFSEISEGARHRGRPHLHYKETLKQSLNACKLAVNI